MSELYEPSTFIGRTQERCSEPGWLVAKVRRRTAKVGIHTRSIMRAIPTLAVDNSAFAGGNCRQYRPHKIPANGHIFRHAVDAGGILRVSFRIGKLPACVALSICSAGRR